MIHTVTNGVGQPIVMLHGFATSHKYWNKVLSHIPQDKFQIRTPDMLGFGQSHKPNESNYSVDEHVEILVSSVLRDSDEPVILVGHSMGAMVATRIAKRYPQLVKKLVLVNMPLFADRRQASQAILRNLPLLHRAYVSPIGKALHVTRGTKLIKTIPRVVYPKSPEMQEVMMASLAHTRTSLLRSLHNTILAYQPMTDIGEVSSETIFIYSRDDGYFSQDSLDHISTMTQIKTFELPGGHQLPLRQSEAISRAIADFSA